MDLPHIPLWRHGRSYRSLDVHQIRDHRSGEPLAEMSLANPGLIRRDLAKAHLAQAALGVLSFDERIAICARAADMFMNGTLPLGFEGEMQSPDDYVTTLSATSGMPLSMCRANMDKIRYVLAEMPTVLKGLTRGLDLSLLDKGFASHDGVMMSYYANAPVMGMVMPSNSPGVNSLWVPAIPLKVGMVMKPGSEEPWTPNRLVQAFIAAGCPGEAFGFYPTTHEGANTIMTGCGRSIIFGDANTVSRYRNRPEFNVHGPGFSKIVIGEDQVDDMDAYLDILVDSVALNGGRSCVNASTIVVPRHGRKIAEALAEKLSQIKPLPLNHPEARLSAFAKPQVAEAISGMIDAALLEGGAEDLCRAHRTDPERLVKLEGSTFLQPTVIYCDDPAHSLAKKEFLFPFVAVTEVPQSQVLDYLGPSLVVSAVTKDRTFMEQLLACDHIDRLNIGHIPTPKVQWDQPHEGNLFEFLYRRRAIQLARDIA